MYRIRRVRDMLLLLLLCSMNEVTCRATIEPFVGDDVLLPCIYTDVNIFQKNASLYWMDKNDNVILQIKGHETQESGDRVESFPKLYEKGNFSIMFKDVQQSDNGPYDCIIPKMDFHERVHLSVSGERVELGATPPPRPSEGPSDGATVTPKLLHMILSLPLSLLLGRFN